ncbi:hypothetical protein Hanom_Chr12g01118431 [Helianthus anomalus]
MIASEHKEKVITNESDVDEDLCGHIVDESMQLSSSSYSYRSHVSVSQRLLYII